MRVGMTRCLKLIEGLVLSAVSLHEDEVFFYRDSGVGAACFSGVRRDSGEIILVAERHFSHLE